MGLPLWFCVDADYESSDLGKKYQLVVDCLSASLAFVVLGALHLSSYSSARRNSTSGKTKDVSVRLVIIITSNLLSQY